MVNYAIVGTAGFVGLAKHNVAVPFEDLKMRDGKMILPVLQRKRSKQCQNSSMHGDDIDEAFT